MLTLLLTLALLAEPPNFDPLGEFAPVIPAVLVGGPLNGRLISCDRDALTLSCWAAGTPPQPAMVRVVYYRVTSGGRYWVGIFGYHEFRFGGPVPRHRYDVLH